MQEAIGAVRDRGLRLSTPRRLVLEALFAADGPLSAPELSHALALDATSVYRNLELLERHGLVHHVHLGHGPGLYVLAGRRPREYLYCEACGQVTAVEVAELDPIREQIHRRFGHTARFTHFAIVGVCAGCAARGSDPGQRGDAHRELDAPQPRQPPAVTAPRDRRRRSARP